MKFAVDLMEYERGWGSRLDETIYFDSDDYNGNADKALAAAEKYVVDFNAKNTEGVAPDWYMVARKPYMIK